jgi:thioredoxin reductase
MQAPASSPIILRSTFVRAILIAPSGVSNDGLAGAFHNELKRSVWHYEPIIGEVEPLSIFEALRYHVDFPMAMIGVGGEGASIVQSVISKLNDDKSVSRRPIVGFVLNGKHPSPLPSSLVPLGEFPVSKDDALKVARAITSRIEEVVDPKFDKRTLVPKHALYSAPQVPSETDVVIVGAGLLGLYAANRMVDQGFKVTIVEQRTIIGGIWSMYANSFSQVNSSEGGYNVKELLGEKTGNRDHSTSAEMLKDIKKLSEKVSDSIFTGVKVIKVLRAPQGIGYNVVVQSNGNAQIIQCRGAMLCINDRVGIPRPLKCPGMGKFSGIVADGTSDQLVNVDWQNKDVVVVGMGAFAVENTRTALEAGAKSVTVLCRRHGTVCPKIIDYLNFVKPFDSNYNHSAVTNIKQMRQWSKLYRQSSATIPECWPKNIKHEGHTISVSDIWFVAHHMKKLRTVQGTIQNLDETGVVLSDGMHIKADVVVGCIGFSRNTVLCEEMVGLNEVRQSNYLHRDLMYMADAEIDEGAFNSFFGSSVLEFAKFFTEVFIEGLKNPDDVGELLWGDTVPRTPIHERKWSGYIAVARNLIKHNANLARAAAHQVKTRTEHFMRTLPPDAYVKSNRMEWENLHTRLNGGIPVPKKDQLPYFFDEAADWCLPA